MNMKSIEQSSSINRPAGLMHIRSEEELLEDGLSELSTPRPLPLRSEFTGLWPSADFGDDQFRQMIELLKQSCSRRWRQETSSISFSQDDYEVGLSECARRIAGEYRAMVESKKMDFKQRYERGQRHESEENSKIATLDFKEVVEGDQYFEVAINGHFEKLLRGNKRKNWDALYEIAVKTFKRCSSASEARGIRDYFNSDRGNPLYSNGDHDNTKILRFDSKACSLHASDAVRLRCLPLDEWNKKTYR